MVTRFWRNRHGNISLLAALLSVPMVAGLGFAIDYAVALSTKSKLDAAASSAAAIAATAAAEAPFDIDMIQDFTSAKSTGQSAFTSQANSSPASANAPNITVTRYGNSYKAKLDYSAQQNTYFSSLFGVAQITISGSAQAAASARDAGFSSSAANMLGSVGGSGQMSYFTGWTQRGNVSVSNGGAPFSLGAQNTKSTNQQGGRVSKQIYLPAGAYNLQYTFVSRLIYADYGKVSICGTTDADVAWATSATWQDPYNAMLVGSNAQASRIEVYLDPANSDFVTSAVLTPSTNNLIDVCVYSYNNISRDITINVQEPGYYRLTFSSENNSMSVASGIMWFAFCKDRCSQTYFPIDFPQTWTGGILTDSFDSPSASGNATNLNLASSGTWTSSYFYTNKLYTYPSAGWIAAGYDQINFGTTADVAAADGSQHIVLHGTDSNGSNGARGLYRRILFNSGYHYLSYYYRGSSNMGSTPAAGGSWCGPASQFAANDPRNGADAIKVGLDSDVLYLHPVSSGAVRASVTWQASPGATTTPTQQVGTAGNDLEICSYSDSWIQRKLYFKVEKPGYYWLYFAPANGSANNGGRIDKVQINGVAGLVTGIGSLNPQPTVTTLKSHGYPIGTVIQLNKISVVQHI